MVVSSGSDEEFTTSDWCRALCTSGHRATRRGNVPDVAMEENVRESEPAPAAGDRRIDIVFAESGQPLWLRGPLHGRRNRNPPQARRSGKAPGEKPVPEDDLARIRCPGWTGGDTVSEVSWLGSPRGFKPPETANK